MKHNRNPLATAIHYALGAGVVAGLAVTAAPVAAQEGEAAETTDRIVVTGTRIARDDLDAALPVQVIDRVSIEASGKTSVADLLRNQPINQGGSFRPQSGSSAQSFAGLSLRNLGAGRTLILIDGRRAPTAPNTGSGQDLNAIPLAAVERIEILSDGASAVYGSDAIGGVVNIITRSDFTGAELTVGISDPKRAGGETREASAIFGHATDRGRIMAGVSNNKRDIIFQRDRPWSQGGASVFSNNFLTEGGAFLAHPEFGSIVPGDGCTGEGFSTSAIRCFYDFTLQAADEAEIENQSLFLRSSYDIDNNWTMHMNAGVTRVKSFGRYAPVPSSPWLVGGFGFPVLPAGSPNHPGTRPEDGGLNPNWQDYQDPILVENADGEMVVQYAGPDQGLTFLHRFAANGPRDTNTDTNLYDLDFFVTGTLGEYDVEFGARRVESQYYDLGRNYIVSALAQPEFDSGAYNIYDPFSADEDVLNRFVATINRDARYVSREYRAQISGDLFEMASGPAGFAAGYEYRDETYQDIYDDLQAAGNITGSAGNSAFGDRDQWAIYAEFLLPLLDNLELNIAGRYDDYSDFGSEFSPKVSLRWDAMDMLALRASYGEGFRAPPLDILSQQPSFSAAGVVHEPTAAFLGNEDPTEAIQITSFSIANPDLDAETSEQFSIGAVFEPTDWFSATLDYWNIKIKDRVAGIGAQQILNCLEGLSTNCPPGLSVFPAGSESPNPDLGLGAEFGAAGNVVFLQSGFASLGTVDSEGFDTQLRGTFDLNEFGRLRSEINASYLLSQEIDSGENTAGLAGLPRWRAIWSNQWNWGDFGVNWNINYIGSQRSAQSPNLDRLGSWTTHDVQASYFTPWNGRVTLGVDNLGDRDPILDPGENRDFNFNLYNGYGRITYLRYVQTF